MGLAEQRDLVDGVMQVHHAMHVGGAHQERMDHGFPRRGQARVEIDRAELVHQKTDGAAMHAVDRLARAHVPVQRLQHQSVAAERDHDIGVVGIVVAVQPRQLRQRRLRLRASARDEADPVISLGTGHGMADSSRRRWERGVQGRLYDLERACRDDGAASFRAQMKPGRPPLATAPSFHGWIQADRLSSDQYLATRASAPLKR